MDNLILLKPIFYGHRQHDQQCGHKIVKCPFEIFAVRIRNRFKAMCMNPQEFVSMIHEYIICNIFDTI